MYRRFSSQIYKPVVVVWLTLSIASVILASVTWIDLSRKLEAGIAAVAIQHEVEGVLLWLLDAETAQRGYTITGEETFLAPLAAAATNVPVRIEKLAEIVKEDSEMLKKVVALRGQAEKVLEHHREVVSVRRMQGGDPASAIILRGGGKKLMDEARRQIADLRGMRADLVSENAATARERLLRASLTSLVAGGLGVGAGVFAFLLARVMLAQQQRERNLIEEKLHAERTSQEKTVFLANMSHEIRTPMNAILGFSELLGGEIRDPRHRRYLQSIRTSATSLLQLINDILDMSKIEAGVMELRLEPTDPREICDFLHTVFSEPAAKKNVKLACNVAEDLPRALLLDRIRLRQVLVNLVGNAVKFTDKGNIEVRVNWEKQESSSHLTLIIEVQDTGVGIPQDKLESIFKPFVQAGAHREKEKSGTGLGLSIVRRLTEMMGGTVVAASVIGEGSAFSLRFPDIAISARLAPGGKLEIDSQVDFDQLRPAKLLVVDDNEVNCHLVAGMFAGSHHDLAFGSNGRQAVSKAAEIQPDVILLDIRMPGMDGREALAEIRRIPGLELTPIIAVTASSLLNEESELKNRFSGYVRKPFSKRELFDELAQFLPPANAVRSSTTGRLSALPKGEVTVAPGLIEELNRVLTDEWPGVHDSLAFNECRAFAARLLEQARRWSCPALEDYARTLDRHAENYAVDELEKHLFEFTGFVGRLKPGVPAP